MDPPPSLPAALLHRAAADPEEPWLFRAEGWDWVWHSWRELAGWMERWREPLSSLPAGSRVAFRYDARPEPVILDLAIQAAGLVPVPGEGREGDFRVEIEGGEIKISPCSQPTAAGWTSAEIAAAGERLQREIGEGRGREIVVLGGPLEDSLERAMMAWATLTGAAVVLEPDPALRAATAAWARPTVFHGTPEEIADLRSRVGTARKWRLPFRRLRVVVVSGEISEEEATFWRERGVRVLMFPG